MLVYLVLVMTDPHNQSTVIMPDPMRDEACETIRASLEHERDNSPIGFVLCIPNGWPDLDSLKEWLNTHSLN